MSIPAKINLNKLLSIYNNQKKSMNSAKDYDNNTIEIYRDSDGLIGYTKLMSRGFRKMYGCFDKLNDNLFLNDSDRHWIKKNIEKWVRIKNFGVYKAYYKFKNLIKKSSINETTIIGEDFSEFSEKELMTFEYEKPLDYFNYFWKKYEYFSKREA